MTASRLSIASALVGWAVLLATAAGDETPPADPEQSVARGREALQQGWNHPWYDRSTDGVRPLEVVPPRRPPPTKSTEPQTSYDLSWLQLLAWGVIAAVLLALAWFLIQAYLEYENRAAAAVHTGHGPAHDVDRVEALPFMAARVQSDLLAEARRHYEQGNYREAIIYLFSFELVELDRHGVIRLERGKTNRRYLREAAARPPLARVLEQTMVAFEAVFFGKHDLDRAGFEACWSQVSQFEFQASQA